MTARQAPDNYTLADGPGPHPDRARRILAAHPEVRKQFEADRWSALWTLLVIGLQLGIAIALSVWDAPWWAILVAAYIVGAFANHALFVLIHDYTHNAVWKSSDANRAWGIVANIPIIFPSAIGFRNFHLLHHKFLGVPGLDADVPSQREARWVGNSAWRKTLWLAMFWAVQGILRPQQVKKAQAIIDGWVVLNAVAMIAAMAPLVWFWGWTPVAYLFASTLFSLGVHPVGARWIQEHYVFREGQETYSYYGPLNKVAFNMGYHNEHHDFPNVPWSRLPAVRATAPEFYDNLYHHKSWTGLLLKIIFDRSISPFRRIVRPVPDGMKAVVAGGAG